MHLWVVTQCVERIEKQKHNDFEKVGETGLTRAWSGDFELANTIIF